MSRTRLIQLYLILIAACVCAIAQGPVERAGDAIKGRIHLGDVVDVDVLGSFEFDWRGSLNPEGSLDNFDKIDRPVQALCLTEEQLARSIEKEYGAFLRSPQVRVRIVDRSNRPVAYVHGAVRQPHRFRLMRAATLIELLVHTGGITDRSRGEVTIFRDSVSSCAGLNGQAGDSGTTGAEASKPLTIKIADLLEGVPAANRTILSGDIVYVSESLPVYVLGEVAAPRRMNLTPDLNLERAVLAAGGIVGSYRGQKIRIYRRGGDAKVIEFDWKSVSERDISLEPYDVIEVERRGSGPARIPSLPGPEELTREELAKLPLRLID